MLRNQKRYKMFWGPADFSPVIAVSYNVSADKNSQQNEKLLMHYQGPDICCNPVALLNLVMT